jgi:GTP cyclohydrolase I
MTSTLPSNIRNLTTTALSTTEFSAKSLSPNSFSANSLTPDSNVSNSAAVDSVALDSAAIDSPASNSSISSLEAQALPASLRIRQKLEEAGVPYFANDNISEYLEEGDLNQLEAEVADKVRDLLRSLVIDIDNDHNTQETAERVARMYIHEVFKGRYHVQPKIASFPNIKNLDEVYTVGPISIRSACSHHLVPILGNCWIGIKPGEHVIGLSKFARVADWVFSRPHIQEEAVIILADEIERLCKPKGLAILVKAQHYCMKWRGVKELQTSMINSVVRGDFRKDPSLKAEFFELVKQQQDLLST